MRCLIPLLLVACNADKSTSSTPDDSATDTSVDTGEVLPQTGDITGTIRLPESAPASVADLKLGLVYVDYGSGPDLGDTLAVTGIETSGSYSLSLAERPPEEHLTELEQSAHPGLMGSMYLPIAFIDADGDDRFIPGDQVAGGTLSRVLVWLEGDIPYGYVYGWNVIDTGLSGTYETGKCLLDTTNPLVWRSSFNRDYPAIYGLDEPVDVDLLGLEADVVLAGAAAGLPEGASLTLLPYQTLFVGGKDALPELAGLALEGGAFSRHFSGAPDAVYDVSPDPAWDYALAYGVVYDDADGDGAYTDGEGSSDATMCVNNSIAALRYTWPVASYRGWRLMECYSVRAGWRVVTRDSAGTWVSVATDDEASSVVVDSEICSF